MITLNAKQQAIVTADRKTVTWLFDIRSGAGSLFHWSTRAIGSVAEAGIQWTGGVSWAAGVAWGQTTLPGYTFKITDFSGIRLARPKSELGLISPSEVTFCILDPEHLYNSATFTGGMALIALRMTSGTDTEEIGRWRFRIDRAEPEYGRIRIHCRDYYQDFLEGDWPNTPLVRDLFPSSDADLTDNVCVPVPFGTGYVPLRSVYIVNARYYVLGPSGHTYTIGKVRSPRSWGRKSEWEAADGYAFTQAVKSDVKGNSWAVFQPVIADSDLDGVADACGLWRQGDAFLDMPTCFSRSDLASYTNFADVIRYVLEDFGVPEEYLDEQSFIDAAAVFTGWGLAFNYAFWYREPRETILAKLLNACHATLVFDSRVRLQVLAKTSRATWDKSVVLKAAGAQAGGSERQEGTLKYTVRAIKLSDSGYAAWQEEGEAQDRLVKTLVPAKASQDCISSEIMENPFVQESVHVQKAASLYFQRLLLGQSDISCTTKSTQMALRPDDAVSIDHADYGGAYDVLIDAMFLRKDGAIEFEATKFSEALDDWEDLSFAAVEVVNDDSESVWEPPVAGPLSSQNLGKLSYDLWGKGWRVVSPIANAGEFQDIQAAIDALPSEGGSVFLKNGVYALGATLGIPDKELELIGESKEGVILRNPAGSPALHVQNLSGRVKLESFTLESRNGAGEYCPMIRIWSDTLPKTIGNIDMDRIRMMLADDGLVAGAGDDGIAAQNGADASILIEACETVGGARGIFIENLSPEIKIKNCVIAGSVRYGMEIRNCPSYEIRNNRVEDWLYRGLRIAGVFGGGISFAAGVSWAAGIVWDGGASTVDHGMVIGNRVLSASDALEGETVGIDCEGNSISIAENTVSIEHSRAGVSPVTGILAHTGAHKKVTGNEILFRVTTPAGVRGIALEDETDTLVQTNSIVIDQGDFTEEHVGIDLSGASLRNIVAGNSIDAVYNNAQGIGIRLGAESDDNNGTDNLTVNVGTSVEDDNPGGNNNVTAVDV